LIARGVSVLPNQPCNVNAFAIRQPTQTTDVSNEKSKDNSVKVAFAKVLFMIVVGGDGLCTA
jgi:hypothetical protein